MTVARRLLPVVVGVALLLVAAGGAVGSAADTTTNSTVDGSTSLVDEGAELALQAGPGQVIRGETTLPPGSEVTLSVQSRDATNPFVTREHATVGESGTFRATTDLSLLSSGTPIEIAVDHDGYEQTSTNATVGECRNACAAAEPETPTATVGVGNGNQSLEAGPGQVIEGSTNLTPGATVNVSVVDASGDAPAVLYDRTRTVGADGRFRATADLSKVSAESSATVAVSHSGTELANESVRVAACEHACDSLSDAAGASAGTGDATQIRYAGDDLVLWNIPGQTIRGKSALPAGTELRVVVESVDDASPFVATRNATVGEDGTFRATVGDLSVLPSDVELRVSVSRGDAELASASGIAYANSIVTPEPETPTAALATRNGALSLQSEPGQVIRGTTNHRPGTELRVTVGRTGGERPETLSNRTVVVGDDGRFRETVDLSPVPNDSSVTVVVSRDGTTLTNATDRVAPCRANCTAPMPDSPTEALKTERSIGYGRDVRLIETGQGDAVRVPLRFQDERATVVVGGDAMSYSLVATVTDGNDDNNVTVEFATDRIGADAGPLSTVNESDAVTVVDQHVEGDRRVLDEGTYPIRLLAGTEPDGERLGHTELRVRDEPVDEDGNESVVERVGFGTTGDSSVPMFRARIGETTRVPVRTDESDTAVVYLRSGPSSYNFTAKVRDGNGDERVVLAFDTSAAGRDGDRPVITAVAPEDSVEKTTENGRLVADEYVLIVEGSVRSGNHAGRAGTDDLRPSSPAKLVLAEGNSTPTPVDGSPDPSDDGSPLSFLGALAAVGVVASAGIAFVTGLVDV